MGSILANIAYTRVSKRREARKSIEGWKYEETAKWREEKQQSLENTVESANVRYTFKRFG